MIHLLPFYGHPLESWKRLNSFWKKKFSRVVNKTVLNSSNFRKLFEQGAWPQTRTSSLSTISDLPPPRLFLNYLSLPLVVTTVLNWYRDRIYRTGLQLLYSTAGSPCFIYHSNHVERQGSATVMLWIIFYGNFWRLVIKFLEDI